MDVDVEGESDMEYSEQVVDGGEMDDLVGMDQADAKVIVGIGDNELLPESMLKTELIWYISNVTSGCALLSTYTLLSGWSRILC